MKHTPAVICGRMPFINEYDESRLLETGQHPDTFRNYLKIWHTDCLSFPDLLYTPVLHALKG